MIAVPTASLARSGDGTAFSDEFQDVYHSTHGGLAQSRHVFLAGNSLPQRWQGRDAFVILETGFGLGLNFLAAWHAWREDSRRPRRLHFLSVESTPLPGEQLAQALAPFDELAPLARALCRAWPPPLAGFHRVHFDAGNVILTLMLGPAASALPQLVADVDAFFLDGFSPARTPGIWSPEVVRELARVAAPGATLATWTVAGGVRGALADAGFAIEKRPGFAAKREMLVGTFARERAPVAVPRSRHAAVIGAGLAGTVTAERLAARGWEVDLVDLERSRRAPEVGLVRPIVNLRDAMNAQASRSAFLYTLQHLRALRGDGYNLEWDECGVLQLAENDNEAVRFEAIASSHGYPAAFLEYVDAQHAAGLAGHRVRGAGWWFPTGARVSPASLWVATLARAGARVRRRVGRRVARLEREGGSWRALDADDRVVAEAPTVILANAVDAKRLLPEARLPLSHERGQLTYVPAGPQRRLKVVVSGSGYAAPMDDGRTCVGATYDHDDTDVAVRDRDPEANLRRVESMLPGFTEGLEAPGLEGWTGFRTTVHDRLPIFGATAVDGVFTATGLGSRGLLWAPLGAELLACHLSGEPMPLPRDLAGAISPRRFLS
jgi:tRNA 5-methylaminomethyl-2-thiouridine biosynthesis bifunctional protein